MHFLVLAQSALLLSPSYQPIKLANARGWGDPTRRFWYGIRASASLCGLASKNIVVQHLEAIGVVGFPSGLHPWVGCVVPVLAVKYSEFLPGRRCNYPKRTLQPVARSFIFRRENGKLRNE